VDEDDGRPWNAVVPQGRVDVDDALTATPRLGNGQHEGLQERRIGHIRIESDIRPCREPAAAAGGSSSGADVSTTDPGVSEPL
jgi:hypothetical protein